MNDFKSEFLKRAPQRLLTTAPQGYDRSDDDMNALARMIPDDVITRPAAVLVPIIERASGLSVLLTKRPAHMKSHPGQIAFPGGRLEQGETALDAALRETEEETGLDRSFVKPLGFLDGYLTVTAFIITPVVAMVREGFTIRPHAGEVDEVFEVPLVFLMSAENCRRDSRDYKGVDRRYYAFQFESRYIWGATAGIIKNMQDKLYG